MEHETAFTCRRHATKTRSSEDCLANLLLPSPPLIIFGRRVICWSRGRNNNAGNVSPKNRWGIRENAVAWLSRRARSLDGAWAGFVCSALFSGHGKIALCDGRREKGGKRKNDTLTRFDVSRSGISSLDYIRIGVCIIIDNNVSVGAWFFFVGSTDYFTLGRRGRVEKLAGRCQKKFFTRARRHNALSSFQSY